MRLKLGGGDGGTVKLTCNGVTHQNMNPWLFIFVLIQYEQLPVSRGGECKAGAQGEEQKCFLLVFLTEISMQKLTHY